MEFNNLNHKLTVISILTAILLLFSPLYASSAYTTDGFPWFKKKKKAELPKDSTDSKNSYSKITGKDSKQWKGMFNVYQNKDDYYFEIPTQLLGKDMLVVNKLLQVPSELNEAGVNRGINYQNQMVRFELNKNKTHVFIRQQRVQPSFPQDDIISSSVVNNYISPIIASYKIEGFNADSTTYLIKVNEIYDGTDNSINNVFSNINLGTSPISDLSHIKSIKAFENNVVAVSELTTKVTEGTSSVNITVVVSSSLVLLPPEEMTGRLDNQRIGYFTTPILNFSDDQQRANRKEYITRWRLEPKAGEEAEYLSGKLVEPKKPITFYLDRAIPSKWRKYIIQGIEDWQVAFEKAGFKNAIIALEMTDSIAHDADDINYSEFTYAASTKANAMGPSIIDPRSGEIIEADIIWWHNVLSMLQGWIRTQTGVVNPEARSNILPDHIMGDAVRFVACHEVGHSLGLRHNMMGSWAFPTDSLRSKTFTDKTKSTSSSIMDYARFNYIAQPEDSITNLSPNIGPYDLLAIEYGYRWYGKSNPEDEKEQLQSLLDAHTGNLYKFSEAQDVRDAVDPRAQNEDLGNDPVRSSELGIKNLKRIVPEIINWTTTGEKGQTYEEASRLYYSVINQWNNYLYHVLANIGGIYMENTTVGDGNKTFTHVEKEKQKESLQFLMNEVLTMPSWLFDNELSKYTYLWKSTPNGIVENAPTQVLKNAQAYILWDLLLDTRILRMLENEHINKTNAFTAVEMLDMLHNHIFGITERGGTPDVMMRSLQKGLVDALINSASTSHANKDQKKLMSEHFLLQNSTHSFCSCPLHCEQMMDNNKYGAKRTLSFYGSQIIRTSDAISVKRGELIRIKNLLEKRQSNAKVGAKYHYLDLILRINTALGISK